MRIAFFTETFLPNFDGVVNTLCRLLQYLEGQDHEVVVFAPEGGPQQYAGARVIGRYGMPFPLYPEIKLVSPLDNFEKELLEFKPDLVHVLNPISLGMAGIWHARQLEIPLVASFHTDVAGFAERWGFGFISEMIWTYSRMLHNQALVNWAPSHATATILRERGFERVSVWSRGVDAKHYHPLRRDMDMRRRLSAGNPDAPLLLYTGRLSQEKRVNWIKRVLKSRPDVRLAIVGDGPYRTELEKLYKGTAAVFTGALRGLELAQAYASADIFVFPAANETFGNVVLEAMASGLPVITANAGGPLDFVQHKENGLVFQHTNRKSFKKRVLQMLKKSPQERKAMGLRGRRLAAERSWASVFSSLMAEYEGGGAKDQCADHDSTGSAATADS
ncbi:MAG: glycosyltransferase family 1 protein [Leptospiraceae bacterium]|nr:glycosyltransferase family 1 protein [Leptospiraceae bacterium]